MILRSILTLLILLLVPFGASADFVPIPPHPAPVTDETGVLGDAKSAIEQKILALKAARGSEVGVLIIPSTQPETIEQYSIRVVDAWKLGRKGVDDGVLLLVALRDRTVRIEVGRGLEGDIPDLKAHRIIDEQIVPRFKAGDVAGGVTAGVDALIGLIEGADLPPPFREKEVDLGLLIPLVILSVFVGSIIAEILGELFGALVGGGLGLLLGYLAFPLGLAILLAIISMVLVTFRSPLVQAGTTPSRRRGGGWGGGSFGGGSFGGGSFGGGGGFSGGGASGRW